MDNKVMLVKLMDQNRQTGHRYTVTTWRKGFRPPRLSGQGDLCSPGYYHAYEHILLAVLHNPIHADFINPRAYKIECDPEDIYRLDGQMKVGFTTGLTLSEVAVPEIALEQRVRYAIGIACAVYPDNNYRLWADRWMDGTDQSARAAWAAWAATWGTARAAAWAAKAAEAATWAAWAARGVAETTAKAAAWVAEGSPNTNIDLLPIAHWAMTDEPLSTLFGE